MDPGQFVDGVVGYAGIFILDDLAVGLYGQFQLFFGAIGTIKILIIVGLGHAEKKVGSLSGVFLVAKQFVELDDDRLSFFVSRRVWARFSRHLESEQEYDQQNKKFGSGQALPRS